MARRKMGSRAHRRDDRGPDPCRLSAEHVGPFVAPGVRDFRFGRWLMTASYATLAPGEAVYLRPPLASSRIDAAGVILERHPARRRASARMSPIDRSPVPARLRAVFPNGSITIPDGSLGEMRPRSGFSAATFGFSCVVLRVFLRTFRRSYKTGTTCGFSVMTTS
jgi:hypothetical protein